MSATVVTFRLYCLSDAIAAFVYFCVEALLQHYLVQSVMILLIVP